MPLYTNTVQPTFFPSDHGLLAWACDPSAAVNASNSTNGTLFMAGLPIRVPTLISTLWVSVATVAVTPTAGQNGLALISPAGTVLSTAMSDSLFTTVGARSGTLAAAQTAQPGMYWVGILGQASTPATLNRGIGILSSANANLSAAGYRYCVNGTGLTAFPGSVTPASNSLTNAVTFWAAAS